MSAHNVKIYWSLLEGDHLLELEHGGRGGGVSSEEKSEHIYFLEENLLHAFSKLGKNYFHTVIKTLSLLWSVVKYNIL